jgi:hypothetical protein
VNHPAEHRSTHPAVVLVAGAALAAAFSALDIGALCGLKAAGLTGTPPAGATAFQTLIGTLTQNALWIIVTGFGLVATLVAGMMAFGSRSAPDVMFRVIAAIAIILIVIPGVLA